MCKEVQEDIQRIYSGKREDVSVIKVKEGCVKSCCPDCDAVLYLRDVSQIKQTVQRKGPDLAESPSQSNISRELQIRDSGQDIETHRDRKEHDRVVRKYGKVQEPEKSHIFWTLFFSKACPRKYRAPAMQNSIRAYARTSADRLTVAGENARKVTAIRLADLFATIL